MKAGYGERVLTPNLDRQVYLAGFDQNRLAEGVHDDLSARAMGLSDGDTTLVICGLDLISLFQNDVREIIQRVQVEFPAARVILAATHTHHGPDTMGIYGPDNKTSGVDPRIMADLKDKITAAIMESLALDRDVGELRTGSVRVPGIAKNARDPAIIDDELTCLQLCASDQKVMVTLMNFPCHPEVLFNTNTQITADYPGVLREEVEAATGAPCIFTSGALGGMMTPDVKEHSFEEAKVMGRVLAAEGLQVLAHAVTQVDFAINIRQVNFSARFNNPLFRLAIRRGLLPEPRDDRGRVTTETNLVQIGDCWWVTVPGELLPKLGLQIKSMLVQAGAGVTGVIGLANDELGYILPKEEFRYPLNPFRPGAHYEETMSISKEIGPRLMAAVEGLFC